MTLNVYLDESENTLYGEVTAAEGDDNEAGSAEPVTPGLIQQRLEALLYFDLVLDPQSVNQLCTAASQGQALKVALKQLIDATADITVGSDGREALLTLHKADGGVELPLDELKSQIAAKGIVDERVDWEAVESALQQGEVADVVIATAQPAVKGDDAVFEALVEGEHDRVPVVNEQGVADMLSTHVFVIVEAGEALMRRHPPSQGEPGMNVLGEIIEPVPGKDAVFRKDLQGSELSTSDPDLLIASIKGHPLVYDDGVCVDPVLHVENVSLETGNIKFDGSLEVKGDIEPGLEVVVSGDVVVKGAVERARIKAGNNVIIQGGVFGGQELDEGSAEESDASTVGVDIEAGGVIDVGFLNQASIVAQGDIRVKQYAAHSLLRTTARVSLGQSGGKGAVFGGLIIADKGATIAQAGNESFVPTFIRTGRLDQLRQQEAGIKQDMQARQTEVDQLKAVLARLKGPEKLGKVSVDKTQRIENTINAIEGVVSELNAKLREVSDQMPAQAGVKVVVTKRLYPNTTLTINGVSQRFRNEMRADSWHQVGEKLIASSEAKES